MTQGNEYGDPRVTAFWTELGLPGLIDVHTHFMPPRLQERVWSYFDQVGPLTGREWPIHYRIDAEQRVAGLEALGVKRFSALAYPHKPGMAESLNDWTLDFAARTPACVPTATFFAEPGAEDYVRAAIGAGARLFKCHVQVGGFDPRDPLLDGVWGRLAEAQIPVIAHVGGGPVPGAFTGPAVFGEVLARHPRLPAVIAHLGMPDVEEFCDLAERFEQVRLDTTMAFVDFWEQPAPSSQVVSRLGALGHKILLGTDFPAIPYRYGHQLEVLARLDLGDDWLRAVCWENAAALLGVEPSEPLSPVRDKLRAPGA
jgi:imidazolonepropionase-like amidohydrolase